MRIKNNAPELWLRIRSVSMKKRASMRFIEPQLAELKTLNPQNTKPIWATQLPQIIRNHFVFVRFLSFKSWFNWLSDNWPAKEAANATINAWNKICATFFFHHSSTIQHVLLYSIRARQLWTGAVVIAQTYCFTLDGDGRRFCGRVTPSPKPTG